jgi:hypothetical protein
MSEKKPTQKFTDDERAAMKERAQELKAQARRTPRGQEGGRGERRARKDGHAFACA